MENTSTHVQEIDTDLHQTIEFSEQDRAALYKTIFNRRDVRGQFKPDPISDEVLSRILYAAHHAPSVGFMQPWNFMIIRSPDVKQKVHNAFVEANNEAANMFEGEKSEKYRKLKLEGILESPVNICITCDRERTGSVVLGRTHIKTVDLYSSVCAVQNLWLAARAENIGIGWVSIIKQEALRDALGIPDNIVPIAYLCVGHVSHFLNKPELENKKWAERTPLEDLIYFDQWENTGDESNELIQHVINNKDFHKTR